MRMSAIQPDASSANGKKVPGYIPEEAIKTSEEARNPLITDENGTVVRAKELFHEDGDPFSEDRVSVEKSKDNGSQIPDPNVMPG